MRQPIQNKRGGGGRGEGGRGGGELKKATSQDSVLVCFVVCVVGYVLS